MQSAFRTNIHTERIAVASRVRLLPQGNTKQHQNVHSTMAHHFRDQEPESAFLCSPGNAHGAKPCNSRTGILGAALTRISQGSLGWEEKEIIQVMEAIPHAPKSSQTKAGVGYPFIIAWPVYSKCRYSRKLNSALLDRMLQSNRVDRIQR